MVDYKPHKTEKNRTRVTVGGDRINCDYGVLATTCSLPTSTPEAKYFTMDISDFYLGSLLGKPEYM